MSKSERAAMQMGKHQETRANILLLMSGSIACAKASSLISEWAKQGHNIRVACTRSVAEFVGPSTLQGLGAEHVFDNVFAPGQAMEHISLGKWADIIIAAPATSNLINKLSAGIADDAVTTLWQAAYGQGKPMVIVPAMNTRMWRYPATRESVSRLKQWGIHVLPVGKGELACGEHGEGRMLETSEIMQSIRQLLAVHPQANRKNILITAGGTRERIDSVRYICNMSSGRTASSLADELTHAGHRVTWLGAKDAVQPMAAQTLEFFNSFADLKSQLQTLLSSGDTDTVIHAAAVSDFSVARIETPEGNSINGHGGKLPSHSDLLIHLERNPKLLDSLKDWSGNPALQVIGFKLTDTEDPQQRLDAVRKQLNNSGVDAVVHNDLSDINEEGHRYRLHTKGHKPVSCKNSSALAMTIDNLLGAVS
jgi:phosphopantothenoylcysteine decarboxylase/phosphopantothenate--cysteine ligase